MKKYLIRILACVLVLMAAGCIAPVPNPGITGYEREEIRWLINRFGNALLIQDSGLARSCLVPGGPHDRNFDFFYRQIQAILNFSPAYPVNNCSLPMYGVTIDQISVNGEWAEVTLSRRQVCGYCDSWHWWDYPVASEGDMAVPAPPPGPDQISDFNRWVCFENTFLVEESLVLRRVGGVWLMY